MYQNFSGNSSEIKAFQMCSGLWVTCLGQGRAGPTGDPFLKGEVMCCICYFSEMILNSGVWGKAWVPNIREILAGYQESVESVLFQIPQENVSVYWYKAYRLNQCRKFLWHCNWLGFGSNLTSQCVQVLSMWYMFWLVCNTLFCFVVILKKVYILVGGRRLREIELDKTKILPNSKTFV